ncbi:MAG: hypothetical protein ACYTF0_08260 [Planctomycetota bacterium]
MRVSTRWISRLLGVDRLPLDDEELVRRVTLHLAEIDEIERTGPNLDGVVVGRVLTCNQHPNADRLRVTTVDVGGDEPAPIVCGAANVAAGQTVAVALPGATKPRHDLRRRRTWPGDQPRRHPGPRLGRRPWHRPQHRDQRRQRQRSGGRQPQHQPSWRSVGPPWLGPRNQRHR